MTTEALLDSLKAEITPEERDALARDAVPRISRYNRATLLRIVRYCREHRLRLLLVGTPVYPAYAACIPVAQRRFVDATRRAARQAGAVVLDHESDLPLTDDDYFDPDHLTHEGAARFTLRLSAEL